MSNRNILEEALTHLLNENEEKASELFHEFMVKKARAIHESLRSEDDVLDEDFFDLGKEYFVEDDLSDEAAVTDGDTAEVATDDETVTDGDIPADAAEEVLAADSDVPAEGEGDLDDRLADVEDQLSRLVAEFEELMSTDDEVVDADEATVDADADAVVADSAEAVEDDMSEEVPAESDDTDTVDDDEFDDIKESVLDELKKITIDMEDGKEVGSAGKKLDTNKPSGASDKIRDTEAKPVDTSGGDTHTDWDLETAPPVVTMKGEGRGKKPAPKPVTPPKNTLLSTKK